MQATRATIAIGYMRVAAANERFTLAEQRAAIEAWAQQTRIAVASWQCDDGVDGATPIAERPGLVAAYRAIKELGAGVLVAARRDRFACDVFVAGLVEQAALARGAQLLSVDDTALASGAMRKPAAGQSANNSWTRGAVDLFVAYQRAVNRARTREALAAKRVRGERIGAVPYGYRLAADGLHLEADAAEQAVLARVRELSAAGLSQRAIVGQLNAHGVVGRTGAPLQKTQVARMLVRTAA